jgi:hypothetical protein
MKRLRAFVLALGIFVGAGVLMPSGAYAVDAIAEQCNGVSDSAVCNSTPSAGDIVKNIINVLLFIVGAISVVMIIAGGIMYTTSNGDSANVTKAKNTLTYAIVGLGVSFVAFAVVNFVITTFIK